MRVIAHHHQQVWETWDVHQTGCMVFWESKRELQVVSGCCFVNRKPLAITCNCTKVAFVVCSRETLHSTVSNSGAKAPPPHTQCEDEPHRTDSTLRTPQKQVFTGKSPCVLLFFVLFVLLVFFSDGFLYDSIFKCSFVLVHIFSGFFCVLFMLFFLCRPSWMVVYVPYMISWMVVHSFFVYMRCLEAKGWGTSLLLLLLGFKLSSRSLGT